MPPSKLSVELLVDIANVGRHGEIIEVSTSQARNYLIPKKLAREVTPERIKQIEIDKKRSADQARMRLEQAFDIQKQLDGQTLEFTLKGKGNKVFGGLGEHEVGTRIKQKFGIDFEKKDIKLPNKTHIKTAGSHMVYLHITRDTLAKVFINVTIDE
ncbi:MAG: 50S ribosomal protein L9 [Candidatus Gracilibacteria bacterium]|nr:50S ribosomal protein L9 [Candidatus Gracilibacteria bacterium]